MPLRIDVLRHGQAAPSGPGGDSSRPLTPDGARAIRALGERLATEGWAPERVLSSPLRRAIETAGVLLEAAALRREVEPVPELEPERDPADVAALLGAEPAGHVLLVGHQPLVGRIAAHWCGQSVGFAPGELVEIEFDCVPGFRRGSLIRHLKA